MNKKLLSLLLLAAIACAAPAYGWDLSELLGKAKQSLGNNNGSGNSGDLLGVVDNLFSNSDFDLTALKGSWEVTGAAVGLDSDSSAAKLAGKAATATLENKLNPYFDKYGLTGATITFDDKGNFVLKSKKLEIKGTVAKTGKGEFATTFSAIGSMKLPAMDTWFEKGLTGRNLSVMWDAGRAMELLKTISSTLKLKSASTISSLLSQYKDMYIGFKLTRRQ